ncbi:hypothetical protein F4604DRAFT_1676367 [Suillus subluteus]|nr:hypothetical protein F4604DRAFT_1676367 [Suillus subluteus]
MARTDRAVRMSDIIKKDLNMAEHECPPQLRQVLAATAKLHRDALSGNVGCVIRHCDTIIWFFCNNHTFWQFDNLSLWPVEIPAQLESLKAVRESLQEYQDSLLGKAIRPIGDSVGKEFQGHITDLYSAKTLLEQETMFMVGVGMLLSAFTNKARQTRRAERYQAHARNMNHHGAAGASESARKVAFSARQTVESGAHSNTRSAHAEETSESSKQNPFTVWVADGSKLSIRTSRSSTHPHAQIEQGSTRAVEEKSRKAPKLVLDTDIMYGTEEDDHQQSDDVLEDEDYDYWGTSIEQFAKQIVPVPPRSQPTLLGSPFTQTPVRRCIPCSRLGQAVTSVLLFPLCMVERYDLGNAKSNLDGSSMPSSLTVDTACGGRPFEADYRSRWDGMLIFGSRLDLYPTPIKSAIEASVQAYTAYREQKYAGVTNWLGQVFDYLKEGGFENRQRGTMAALQQSHETLERLRAQAQPITMQGYAFDPAQGCVFAQRQNWMSAQQSFQQEYDTFQRLFEDLVLRECMTAEQWAAYQNTVLRKDPPDSDASDADTLVAQSPPPKYSSEQYLLETPPSRRPSPVTPERPAMRRFRNLLHLGPLRLKVVGIHRHRKAHRADTQRSGLKKDHEETPSSSKHVRRHSGVFDVTPSRATTSLSVGEDGDLARSTQPFIYTIY